MVNAGMHEAHPPRLRVALHDDPRSRPLGRALAIVLTDLGIRSLDPPEPELLIVVSCGEPSRVVFEQAQQHGITHLPVMVDEDRVRIGPTVIPARTRA